MLSFVPANAMDAMAEACRADRKRRHARIFNMVKMTANLYYPASRLAFLPKLTPAIQAPGASFKEERNAIQKHLPTKAIGGEVSSAYPFRAQVVFRIWRKADSGCLQG